MDEEVIPGHILNLMCAIHLRQDHGYKAWTFARFTEHFPGLCTGDAGFGFTALHVLHHTRVAPRAEQPGRLAAACSPSKASAATPGASSGSGAD
jgi:hypothetical protein